MQRRDDQRPGGQRRPQPAAEDRDHEGIEDAQRRARQAGQRRQPEKLVGGEGEADERQLGDDDRPDLPDGEGQEQGRDRKPEIAAGDLAALLLPEGPVFRTPVGEHGRAFPGRPAGRRRHALHFREGRQRLDGLLRGLLFHMADGEMHPDERAGGDQEEQHETARPQAGEIEKQAEDDRQDEAAEAADHADQAADGTDVLRIVDRDVLEDGGLAERHEEAEDEDGDGEADDTERGVEGDRAVDAVHDIVGRWIGEDESRGDRDEEGPVHDAPGAVDVGEMAAIGAEEARGDREESRNDAGEADVDAIDLDEILRQPQRQGDEGAEDEEVIEREAPDLDVLQGLQFHPGAFRPLAGAAALDEDRIVLGGEPEDDRHDDEGGGPDLGDGVPAEGDEHEGSEELRDRRADIAGAEDAERRALLFGRIPARHIGDADGEGAAGNADAERGKQHLRIGRGVGQQEGRHGGGEHRADEDHAAAVAVRPDAERHADQRAGEDRRADQKAELRFGKAQILTDLDADDCKDRLRCKTDGEGDGAHRQSCLLTLWTDGYRAGHSPTPARIDRISLSIKRQEPGFVVDLGQSPSILYILRQINLFGILK